MDKVSYLVRFNTRIPIIHTCRENGEPTRALNRSHADWIRSSRRTPSPRLRTCPPPSSPLLPPLPPSPSPSLTSRRRLPPRRHPLTSLILPLILPLSLLSLSFSLPPLPLFQPLRVPVSPGLPSPLPNGLRLSSGISASRPLDRIRTRWTTYGLGPKSSGA